MKILSPDGRFEILLTNRTEDIHEAQHLRYKVFYEEMNAKPNDEMKKTRRDFDIFDEFCDHMIVRDIERAKNDQVVGAYRMLRDKVAKINGGFYSAKEYDLNEFIDNLESHNACEIGRSCVHFEYRNNQIIQLLWRGLAHYYAKYELTRIFGCASFPGCSLDDLSIPLSYLYHYHLASDKLRVKALPNHFNSMNLIAKKDINIREAIKLVPPLIRAYLRLGGVCGDGAVIDQQFGTTDVFMVLAMEDVPEKYHDYFERDKITNN